MIGGKFHKMHGLGNDFVVIDCRSAPMEMDSQKARNIADRRTGIGCDQLILIEQSDICDVRMRIFNHDGSEVESCGNATRCVVALLDRNVSIETKGGLLTGVLADGCVSVDIGMPRFEWTQIPLAYAMDSDALPLAWEELSGPMCVNVGNPHAIFFLPNVDSVDLEILGPIIEHDIVFPERINVNIASVSDNKITLRVWERGVGLTRACGTGACATAVAAIRKGLVQSPVIVEQSGGQLNIAWRPGQSIKMTGGTNYVFKGYTDWNQF
jgi:diaminopimelate epimerase